MNSSDFRRVARERLAGKWGKAIGIVVCYMLIIFVLSFIQGLLSTSIGWIISLAMFLIEVPLAYGLTMSLYKIFKNENTEVMDFMTEGFNNFSRSWGVALRVALKLILPIIVLIIGIVFMMFGMAGAITSMFSPNSIDTSSLSGSAGLGVLLVLVGAIWYFVKSLSYAVANIIAIDRPELSPKDAVEESKTLMTGKVGKYFILCLSFIGWFFLVGLASGVFYQNELLQSIVSIIGYTLLVPYIQFATFAFYRYLTGDNITPNNQVHQTTAETVKVEEETNPIVEENNSSEQNNDNDNGPINNM